MPGFDGTGPRGFGPMTGWRRGNCVGPGGFLSARGGLGRFGSGGGRGWRNRNWAPEGRGWGYPGYHTRWFNADIPADEELQYVRDELEKLKKKEQK